MASAIRLAVMKQTTSTEESTVVTQGKLKLILHSEHHVNIIIVCVRLLNSYKIKFKNERRFSKVGYIVLLKGKLSVKVLQINIIHNLPGCEQRLIQKIRDGGRNGGGGRLRQNQVLAVCTERSTGKSPPPPRREPPPPPPLNPRLVKVKKVSPTLPEGG